MLKHTYTTIGMIKGSCSHQGEEQQWCTACGHERILKTPKDPDNHRWMYMGMYWPEQCVECGTTKSETGSDNAYDLTSGTTDKKKDPTTPPVIQWAPNPGEIWVGRPPWS